jgi:hypothetical protein
VRQVGGDDLVELGDELMHALRREIQDELLDGDRPIPRGIVRAKDGSKSPGTNLIENTKWSECVRWRRASSFCVQ